VLALAAKKGAPSPTAQTVQAPGKASPSAGDASATASGAPTPASLCLSVLLIQTPSLAQRVRVTDELAEGLAEHWAAPTQRRTAAPWASRRACRRRQIGDLRSVDRAYTQVSGWFGCV